MISFEGKMVVPKGQIRLPMQAGTDVIEVDFIVIDAFFPDRNGDGPENGGKSSEGFFRFKIGGGPSKG